MLEEEAERAQHNNCLRDVYVVRVFSFPELALQDTDDLTWIENLDRSRNSGEIGFRTAMILTARALAFGGQFPARRSGRDDQQSDAGP